MLENISQSKYSEAVDSYTALNVSSKIRGKLIEKEEKNIKIDIGNSQALDIELREDVSIEKGETVLIDRRNIVKSKVIDLKEDVKIEKSDIDMYSSKLNELGIDVNEENIKTIKKLDSFGIDITSGNVETYRLAKNSLKEIATSLDYDNTIKLMEMDVDIENESIQKLASLVEGLEEEREGFNILKMFKKKDLTTEEAEGIAKKLYGSKMGKDIVDIIKSLHKKSVNITKKNIEKINDVFYKLDNLKDIEDKTFINAIKNKLAINIENLYKVKRYVKDETISMEMDKTDETKFNVSKVAMNKVINIRGYYSNTQSGSKITSRELEFLQEDIEDLMIDLDLEPSEENIKLSKEFIKRNMDVTKEHMVGIGEMKEALKTVVQNLDKQTAAQLIKENIDIESTDIRKIAQKIDAIKNPNKVSERATAKDVDVSELKKLKQALIKVIEKVEIKAAEMAAVAGEVVEPQTKKEPAVSELKQLKQEVLKVMEQVETKVSETVTDEVVESQAKKEPVVSELKQEVLKVIEPQAKKEQPVSELKQLKQEVLKVMEQVENKVAETVAVTDEVVEPQAKKEQPVQELKQLKQEVLEVMEQVENKVLETTGEAVEPQAKKEQAMSELKELKHEVLKVIEKIENRVSEENIEKMMNKIDVLKKVDEKDILSLLEKNVDFKISKIEQVIFGKRDPVKIESADATYTRPIEQATLKSIDKISTAFKDIGKLDFNTISLQIKRNIPMTISNMQKSSAFLDAIDSKSQLSKEKEYEGNEITGVIKALNRNNLDSNKFNIQKAMEVYKSYNNIRDNLTSNMVRNAVENNIKIENMDISLASKYLDNYTKSQVDYESIRQSEKERYAHEFTESTSDMMKNIDENIMFLIKNKKSISFKELKGIQNMFQNENQLGHKISELEEVVRENGDREIKQKFEKLKVDILNVSKGMSQSQEELEKAYKDVEKSIDEIEDNLKFADQYQNDVVRKKSKEIAAKIDENRIIAKENGIIQIPLYVNGQFTNLNMYFRDKQREKSKEDLEDISVVLSIDTVNMGNININLEIEKKNVNMKIGLKNIDDRSHMESQKNLLVDFLERDGYSIGEVSFHSEEEIDILGLEESSQVKNSISDSNLDVKI